MQRKQKGTEAVTITVDGRALTVPAGTTVAVALLMNGRTRFRTSVTGEPRNPLCGMGTCLECRLTIDGRAHCRSCQVACREGLEVVTT
jgi:predicted molibdopterin-dependent oxidoreductase YjgC